MRMAPEARVDDGLLSVVVVEAVPALQLAAQIPAVFRGTHLAHPRVRCFSTRSLRVEADRNLPVTLDGELLGTTPAVVQPAPYRVRLMVPG